MSRVNFLTRGNSKDYCEGVRCTSVPTFTLRLKGIGKSVKIEDDFSHSSWDAVFEEIERHSRFEVLGRMVDTVTGQTYFRVLEYKEKCYYAYQGGMFSSTDGFISFADVSRPYNLLKPAEEFPYFLSLELIPEQKQPFISSFRTADEAREQLRDFSSRFPNTVITHNIPEK